MALAKEESHLPAQSNVAAKNIAQAPCAANGFLATSAK
jgi:hypothetical protein